MTPPSTAIEIDIPGARLTGSLHSTPIAYYQPAQSLVLYYEDVGTFPGITPVGWYDDIAALRAFTSDFTATTRRGT